MHKCLPLDSKWCLTVLQIYNILCINILQWTVNGVLRVGFFVRKPIKEGEELTFDYQFEVYG